MRRYISHIIISQIRHISKVNEIRCYWIISKLEYKEKKTEGNFLYAKIYLTYNNITNKTYVKSK